MPNINQLCLRSAKYKEIGQTSTRGCSQSSVPTEAIINMAMKAWYDQYENVPNLQEIESLASTSDNIYDFTSWGQLMKSEANRIGCSIVQYSESYSKCKMLTCTYSAGIKPLEPIFTLGAPASQCEMGSNPKYPGILHT